jgi:hypothetical protein
LYITPRPEVLTVLCCKHEPSDIKIVATGKLKLHSACKGYGSRILIQAQTTMPFNNTDKDIIPLYLFTIMVVYQKRKMLNKIHLDLPLKNVITRLDHLRLASRKVEEVERLISEED